MSIIGNSLDALLHLDKDLGIIIQNYGSIVYLFLFLIILLETGLVITPFLPGDSLIFVAGIFAANGDINIIVLIILLSMAAIIGDSLNYLIGKYIALQIHY